MATLRAHSRRHPSIPKITTARTYSAAIQAKRVEHSLGSLADMLVVPMPPSLLHVPHARNDVAPRVAATRAGDRSHTIHSLVWGEGSPGRNGRCGKSTRQKISWPSLSAPANRACRL